MPSHLRNLAGATAVALAFSPLASAQGLYENNNAVNAYRGDFSVALRKAAGNDEAGLRARGFMVELEKVLANRPDKAQIVVYPQSNSNNMLVVAAVVPPKGAEGLPIPVCAQQNGKPLAAWNITAKGEVIPRVIVPNPEGSTRAACNGTIMAALQETNQHLAGTPAQPPPVATVAAMPVRVQP